MTHLQPNTTLQGGKYKIERVLGQGGFGITYLAVQKSFNRYVAIKELFIGGEGQAINDRQGNMVIVTNPVNQSSFNQQKEKFKKESLRLSNLSHPNLVKVHEFFEENGTAYFTMDYIDGESLRSKLNREGRLSESLVLKYLQQILLALEVAHRQNIWHLDIKPANIVVDRYYNAYLIDFGASKHIKPNSSLTTSMGFAFTPGFCPPELSDLSNESPANYLQALKDIGPWTDIYSLGATMYNLLTDSLPPSKRRLEKDGCNAFLFPSDVSLSIRNLIVCMMKPDKEDRPQSVQEVFFRLNQPSSMSDEGTIYESGYSVSNNTGNGRETSWRVKSRQELENEALNYYKSHDIEILNRYGFFQQKKKRQASIIWASSLFFFILSIIVGAIIIENLGIEHFGVVGCIIYVFTVVLGIYPGMTVGPAIIGLNDKNHLNDLAENIKKQFVQDYIEEYQK